MKIKQYFYDFYDIILLSDVFNQADYLKKPIHLCGAFYLDKGPKPFYPKRRACDTH